LTASQPQELWTNNFLENIGLCLLKLTVFTEVVSKHIA